MTGIPMRISPLLDEAVKKLHQRMVAAFPLELTHQEFLDVFAPREHHKLLCTAREIASCWASNEIDIRIPGSAAKVQFVFRYGGYGTPLLPRSPAIQPDAPEDLVHKVTSWVNQRIEIGINFGLVRLVLSELDGVCGNADQLRFVFPSILGLCSVHSGLTDFAERYRESRAPKSLPRMTQELRDACRSAATTISSALLLPDQSEAVAEARLVSVKVPDGQRVVTSLGKVTVM